MTYTRLDEPVRRFHVREEVAISATSDLIDLFNNIHINTRLIYSPINLQVKEGMILYGSYSRDVKH